MPRWARFLSCSLTGLLLSLSGFLLAACAQERTTRFWSGLQAFLTTPEFWSLVWLFALVAALSLLVGRVLVHLWGLPASVGGFLSGGALALCYIAFLLAGQVPEWGGWAAAWPRIWPALGWISLPFALSGSLTNWLWERLD
jgi:hypothetical protein